MSIYIDTKCLDVKCFEVKVNILERYKHVQNNTILGIFNTIYTF